LGDGCSFAQKYQLFRRVLLLQLNQKTRVGKKKYGNRELQQSFLYCVIENSNQCLNQSTQAWHH